MGKEKIALLFGDSRFSQLKKVLESNYSVENYGVLNAENSKPTPFGCVKSSDILILPLPCCKPNSTLLNCTENIDLKDVLTSFYGKLVLCGKPNKEVVALCKKKNINLVDYYTEEFEVLNAVPSAEGAIKIALENTDITLWKSNCFVLGFGRIAKILAKILAGFGANITICARRPESIAMASCLGFNTQNIYDMNLCDADIIFNTVPALVLDPKNLITVKKDAFIIDLASKPGGVDFKYAQQIGLKTVHALGLPGITSPKTSSDIMINCICSLIKGKEDTWNLQT